MKRNLLTACLIGAASAASASTVQLTFDPTQTITYGMLAVGMQDPVYGSWPTFEDVALVPLVDASNNPLTFAANVPESLTVNVPNFFGLELDYYAFYASYSTNGIAPTDAVVTFSQGVGPTLLNQPWPLFPSEPDFLSETLTPGPAYYYNWDILQLLVMPTMILSAEESSPPAWIQPLWSADGTPRPVSGLDAAAIGQDGYLVNFSNGTYGGSIRAQLVPEPAPVVALGLGLVGLAGMRRSRKGKQPER